MKNKKFTAAKVLLFLEDVGINKVLVSNKIYSGEKKNNKYFIGHWYDYKIKPLHIIEIKLALILKKGKLNNDLYTIKKLLKTKTKSYCYECTDFCDKEVPKVDPNYTCLAVILLDSIIKRDENCYLQVFFRRI